VACWGRSGTWRKHNVQGKGFFHALAGMKVSIHRLYLPVVLGETLLWLDLCWVDDASQ
jgi:hypothetical protein